MSAPQPLPDGVYFGLPFDVYLAVQRLSASGIQKLCASPATFWTDSWLNPDKPEEDEDDNAARMLGRAYHCARLEPERFMETYRRKPSKADFDADTLLTSDAAVKAKLKELGETQTIGTETITERCERLLAAGYEGTIMPLELARFEASLEPVQMPLDARHFDQIAIDMARIRGHADIAPLLTGGQAEVSVLYTDAHGIPMKSRLDYLKPDSWADLKTFDNSRGKQLDQALADFVRYNRVHVQAATHRDAVEAIRTGGLQVQGEATDAQRALVAGLAIRPDELACWYVFQEKNGVPNLLAREFPFFDVPDTIENSWDTGASEEAKARGHDATRTTTLLFQRAQWEIRRAKEVFVLYSEAYQPGRPWFPLNAKQRFSEFDFSQGWLEGKY